MKTKSTGTKLNFKTKFKYQIEILEKELNKVGEAIIQLRQTPLNTLDMVDNLITKREKHREDFNYLVGCGSICAHFST